MNEDWLMLKATLERCRRLCEDFTDLQIVLYSGRALALGNELRLPEHAVRVFSEATVRSSVVFQVSPIFLSLPRHGTPWSFFTSLYTETPLHMNV